MPFRRALNKTRSTLACLRSCCATDLGAVTRKVITLCVGVLFFSQTVYAQPASNGTDNAAANSIIESYRQYNHARYAVRWRVLPEQLPTLLERMPRYQSLVYYTSNNALQAPTGPFVYLGFFSSQAKADQFVNGNRAAFPQLQTIAVTPEEHRALFAIDENDGVFWLGPDAQDSRAEIQEVFRQAKEAYANKNFQRSIQLYSILALSADQEMQIWAQELVGLNFERLGMRDAAMARYRDLLQRQTDGSWTARVEQRLRALETAADDGKAALRESKYADIEDVYWRGIFGQSYSGLSQSGKYIDDRDRLSVLVTNFDFTAGTNQWDGHKVETRLAGYDLMDLSEEGGAAKTRIKRFNVNYTHVETGLNVQAGRQRDRNAGVYGYFDGGAVRYPWNEKLSMGAKVGVPVRFSDFYDTMDHQFASVFAEYRFNDRWFLSAYTTRQTVYGELDRAAYGGTVQYTGDRLSSSANIDYDYKFAELNIFRWNGHYVIDDKSRLSATYGRQRNPFLTTTNILIGQPYVDLEQYLREELNQSYVLYDALERTSLYENGSLSYQYKVDEDLHYTLDGYHSVSTDVPVFISEDGWLTSDVSFVGEYRYSSVGIQAVALNFFGVNDVATMSFRHADTSFAQTNTLQFTERFRLGKKLQIQPKLGLRQSKNKEAESSQTRVRASLGGAYHPWKNTELRIEFGNEVVQDLEGKNNIDNTFLYAGYQARF